MMNDGRRSQFGLVGHFCVECDRSRIRIVLAWQTAKSFAGSAASAATSTFLRRQWFRLYRDACDIVAQLVADQVHDLVRRPKY